MDNDVLEILKKTNTINDNSHFVYTSGKHARSYINKNALYPHTKYTSRIARIIADKYKYTPVHIVVGPSLGGIILSQWTAHHLSILQQTDILSIYTEKTPDNDQILTRGFDKLVKGKKVLVVEDIVTTGGSVQKVINSITKAGGAVVAVCSIVNKDPRNIDPAFIGAPYTYLTTYDTEVYDEKDCPLCRQHTPINTTLGHGRQYLDEKQKLRSPSCW